MGGRRPRIFVSYKHDVDTDRVNDLRANVDTDKYELLVDPDLKAGDIWHRKLERWLRICDAAIVLVSREALESTFCQYEIGILAARRRATAHRPAAAAQFLVFPYHRGSFTGEMRQLLDADPARFGDFQSRQWPGDGAVGIADDLSRVLAYDDEGSHLQEMIGALPVGKTQVDNLARREFSAGRVNATENPPMAIVLGLFDRIDGAGLDMGAWNVQILKPIGDLAAAFDDRTDFVDFATMAAARQIPYETATMLDGLTADGRVFLVPSTKMLAVDLHLANVAASRWSKRPSFLTGLVVPVVVDATTLRSAKAIEAKIKRNLNLELHLELELEVEREPEAELQMWARELERYSQLGMPVTVVLQPEEGARITASELPRLRTVVPWVNILVLAGDMVGDGNWMAKSEAVPMGLPGDIDACEAFYEEYDAAMRAFLRTLSRRRDRIPGEETV